MRKLNLRKEVLTDLTADELSGVMGGVNTDICLTDPCITPPPSQLRCTFSLSPELCGG